MTVWLFLAVVVAFFLIGLGVFVQQLQQRRRQRVTRERLRGHVHRHWAEIVELFHRHESVSYQMSIIKADSLFDDVLRGFDFKGKTMGYRLKEAVKKHPALGQVWEAHKVRNYLVHEPGRMVSSEVARRSLQIFEKGLRELGVK